jgi:hypothetical protein
MTFIKSFDAVRAGNSFTPQFRPTFDAGGFSYASLIFAARKKPPATQANYQAA